MSLGLPVNMDENKMHSIHYIALYYIIAYYRIYYTYNLLSKFICSR